MSEHESVSDRGTFICRIDGRAGYLRLWDDRLELIRSGRRGPQVVGPEVFPLHLVTRVGTGKPGRVFTAVELVVAGGYLELKMPSIDAPRVADLISLLVSAAPVPDDVPSYAAPEPMAALPVIPAQVAEPVMPEPVMPEPVMPEPVMPEPVMPEPVMVESLPADFVMPDFSMKVEMPEWTPLDDDKAAPVDLVEIVSQREYVVAEVEMPQWEPLPAIDGLDEVDEVLLRTLESPAALANPAGLVIPKVEMPEWTPLPEIDQPDTELPEMVLSQIVIDELTPEPVPVDSTEPVMEIEPLPDGSVLAAAAALAELESMLGDIPLPDGDVVFDDDDDLVSAAREILAPVTEGADGASIPSQPSEAVLTLAAAALLGSARSAVEESPEVTPEAAPRPERPADLPPDLERRLAGLEVLRNSGIMTDADFLAAEAELLESVWAETNSA